MLRSRPLLALSALACVMLSGCFEARHPPRPEAWASAPVPTHHPRPLTKGSFEGTESSLLDEYADREYRGEEEVTWRLPTNAKTIIVELLMAAGKDDPHRVLELLTLDATWGVPDRREVRGRKVSTKSDPLGIEFLTALRSAASRLAAKASFSCKPLQPNWGQLADAGAEPDVVFLQLQGRPRPDRVPSRQGAGRAGDRLHRSVPQSPASGDIHARCRPPRLRSRPTPSCPSRSRPTRRARRRKRRKSTRTRPRSRFPSAPTVTRVLRSPWLETSRPYSTVTDFARLRG